MRSFFLALGIGAICVAAYAGCGLTTEGELVGQEPSSTVSSGTGGAGGSMPCTDRSQCDPDTDCTTWACVAGNCSSTFLPDETPVKAGTVGDCKKNVCKDGKPAVLPDDTDLAPDNDPCTAEMCNGGVKQAGPAPDGTACGETGKLACVGGRCSGCAKDPKNCNAPTECQDVTCAFNTCEYPILEGKLILDADNTDCKKIVCDAMGNQATVSDLDDAPTQMGDNCKTEVCAMGSTSPTQVNADEGLKCANPMGVCYNDSVCAAGACMPKPKPPGDDAGDNGVPGDCKGSVCDGNGGTMNAPDDTDVPMDPNPNDCVMPVCTGGNLNMNAPENKGESCVHPVSGMSGKCCGTSCCAGASGNPSTFCDANSMCCATIVCNGTCCPMGASCHQNACCASATVCNNVCCTAKYPCNNTGVCCPVNSQCSDGTCCPDGKNCLGNNTCAM